MDVIKIVLISATVACLVSQVTLKNCIDNIESYVEEVLGEMRKALAELKVGINRDKFL